MRRERCAGGRGDLLDILARIDIPLNIGKLSCRWCPTEFNHLFGEACGRLGMCEISRLYPGAWSLSHRAVLAVIGSGSLAPFQISSLS